MDGMRKGNMSFGSIVAIIGSILIGCGIAWLLAQNWHYFPSLLKIIILFMLTGGAFTTAIIMRQKAYAGVSKAMFVLGALLYTLSVFLIAQIFSTSTSVQGFAWLMLISLIGVLVCAYIFDDTFVLIIGLIEFLIWLVIQYVAFFERTQPSFGLMALAFLATGVLFYGLHLLHNGRGHEFAAPYRTFTVIYMLLFAYILSFQLVLPELWNGATSAAATILVIIIALLGVIAIIAGRLGASKEILPFIALVVLLASVIGVAALIGVDRGINSESGYCQNLWCGDMTDQNSCAQLQGCKWDGGCAESSCFDKDKTACLDDNGCAWTTRVNYATREQCTDGKCEMMPFDASNYSSCENRLSAKMEMKNCYSLDNKASCDADTQCRWRTTSFNGKLGLFSRLWFVWLYANIVLLLAILAIVWYGTQERAPRIINLGILFFGLMIVSRYIGFIIDFGGYTSLSVLFIIGGIILIGGGWLLEKLRRNLVKQTDKALARTVSAKATKGKRGAR